MPATSQMVRRYRSRREVDTRPARSQRQGLVSSAPAQLAATARLHLCLPTEEDIDACVEQWGGRVVTWSKRRKLNAKTPVAPIDMTKDLNCPLLGLFGNDEPRTEPRAGETSTRPNSRAHGKTYEFHRYDGAGHAFFYWHRPLYRPEQAMDGWSKIFAFFGKYLAK